MKLLPILTLCTLVAGSQLIAATSVISQPLPPIAQVFSSVRINPQRPIIVQLTNQTQIALVYSLAETDPNPKSLSPGTTTEFTIPPKNGKRDLTSILIYDPKGSNPVQYEYQATDNTIKVNIKPTNSGLTQHRALYIDETGEVYSL